MVRSAPVEEKTLVHGSKTIAGLLRIGDYLPRLLGDRYIPCCTREPAEGVFHGRPTEWLSLQ